MTTQAALLSLLLPLALAGLARLPPGLPPRGHDLHHAVLVDLHLLHVLELLLAHALELRAVPDDLKEDGEGRWGRKMGKEDEKEDGEGR